MYLVNLEEEPAKEEPTTNSSFKEDLLAQDAWMVNIESELLKLKQSI